MSRVSERFGFCMHSTLSKPFLLFERFKSRRSFSDGFHKANELLPVKKSHVRDNNTKVFLIGAGPGDPDLLTMKAYQVMQTADVALVDWLVNHEIRKLLPRSVEQIFVGKKCGKHAMTQEAICQLMVELAKQGRRVVRLKGGDPAIFARIAEECEVLQAHRIPYLVIPGVTAATGASAYAGIPLTDRECAQSVRFVTAHLKKGQSLRRWPQLQSYTVNETLVIYMGLAALQAITEQLKRIGMPKTTPVAVIDQATLADQQVITGNLGDIARKIASANFEGPSLIIIGEVVNRRNPNFCVSNDMIRGKFPLNRPV
ncbi:MAG: hypothetical protein Alis3KO_18960 [Aliiglaciecola sp.]